MIEVSRLNGSKYYINCDMIEFIEETPDTIISLVSGKKLVVAERAEQIINMIVSYRQKVYIKLPDIGSRNE